MIAEINSLITLLFIVFIVMIIMIFIYFFGIPFLGKTNNATKQDDNICEDCQGTGEKLNWVGKMMWHTTCHTCNGTGKKNG